MSVGGGDRGREVYGRREKRGREAGFPMWREAGEKGKNYATLRTILQSKKCKGAGAKKYRVGTGIKGCGKREVQTPLSPPHVTFADNWIDTAQLSYQFNRPHLLKYKIQ